MPKPNWFRAGIYLGSAAFLASLGVLWMPLPAPLVGDLQHLLLFPLFPLFLALLDLQMRPTAAPWYEIVLKIGGAIVFVGAFYFAVGALVGQIYSAYTRKH